MTIDNNEVIGSLKCIDIANTNILPNVNELYARQHRAANILKANKNATGTSVICPINISLIHFVFVLTSAPNVGELFTKT